MTAASDALLKLADKWEGITAVLSKYERVKKGTTNARRRWNRHQNAFETALDFYEKDLESASKSLAVKAKPKNLKVAQSTSE